VWTEGTGMQLLADFLTANGVSLPAGHTLYDCRAVSADGLTFGGAIIGPSGLQGFVSTIPTPGTVSLFSGVFLVAVRKRPTRGLSHTVENGT